MIEVSPRWRPLGRNDLGFLNTLSNLYASAEHRSPDIFMHLRNATIPRKSRELSRTQGVTEWRRGWESNPRIKVLQTSALPLGYRAAVLEAFRPPVAWSGRRDSNPRHRPWQGRTLPTELLPPLGQQYSTRLGTPSSCSWGGSSVRAASPTRHRPGVIATRSGLAKPATSLYLGLCD